MKIFLVRTLLSAFIVVGALFAPSLVPQSVHADSKSALTQGATDVSGQTGDPSSSASTTITNIINILSIVGGIIAVVMIIIAGYKFITSGGDSSKVASARSALTYAIIGLIIIALSQVVARFVLKTSTSTASGTSSQSSGGSSGGSNPVPPPRRSGI